MLYPIFKHSFIYSKLVDKLTFTWKLFFIVKCSLVCHNWWLVILIFIPSQQTFNFLAFFELTLERVLVAHFEDTTAIKLVVLKLTLISELIFHKNTISSHLVVLKRALIVASIRLDVAPFDGLALGELSQQYTTVPLYYFAPSMGFTWGIDCSLVECPLVIYSESRSRLAKFIAKRIYVSLNNLLCLSRWSLTG